MKILGYNPLMDFATFVTTAVTTAERDHTCTLLSTIMTTLLSIIGFSRNFPVRQLYNRTNADQNAGSSNPLLPRVPNPDTMHPPTTKRDQGDCANSSCASATAVSDHSSYTLTCRCENHATKKPDGNQNEPSPVLPAPGILPTSCSPFPGRHSPNIRNGAEPLLPRLPAANTNLYLPLADDHSFPSESKPSMALSSLPCHPDAGDPERGQPVYTTTALRVSNNCDDDGDTLFSRTNHLLAGPTHYSTISAGAPAPRAPRASRGMAKRRKTESPSPTTAPSRRSAAGNLFAFLMAGDSGDEEMDDLERQPTADGVIRSLSSANEVAAKTARAPHGFEPSYSSFIGVLPTSPEDHATSHLRCVDILFYQFLYFKMLWVACRWRVRLWRPY